MKYEKPKLTIKKDDQVHYAVRASLVKNKQKPKTFKHQIYGPDLKTKGVVSISAKLSKELDNDFRFGRKNSHAKLDDFMDSSEFTIKSQSDRMMNSMNMSYPGSTMNNSQSINRTYGSNITDTYDKEYNDSALEKSLFELQLDRWNDRNKVRALYNHTHQYNYLAQNQISNQNAKQFYTQHLTPANKDFDYEKVPSPLRVTYTLKNSKQRFQKFRENVKNQKKYKKWKNSQLYSLRRRRKHQSYRSGILGIDHPLNKDSIIYPEAKAVVSNLEAQKISYKEQLQEKYKFTSPSERIFFCNPHPRETKYKKQMHLSQSQRLLRDHLPGWKSKKPCEKIDISAVKRNRNSHARVFGIGDMKEFSIDKAQVNRDRDLRGRNYDLIAFHTNPLKITQKNGKVYEFK